MAGFIRFLPTDDAFQTTELRGSSSAFESTRQQFRITVAFTGVESSPIMLPLSPTTSIYSVAPYKEVILKQLGSLATTFSVLA